MDNTYKKNEDKKDFKEWMKEGLSFLLQNPEYKDIAINTLSKLLELGETVEFTYNGCYYEIFESANTGYIVNVYSSDEKDEDGDYLENNIIDGGLCTGETIDAIEFML